ncbi:hypothetical protein TWF506_008660 [Arthrobotrys conoides]|uniref:Uncharacterized protein n=1 Tax=Arthrobotrys conoides TaxID=74498 RepID=A0AAN8RU82_9PEZI
MVQVQRLPPPWSVTLMYIFLNLFITPLSQSSPISEPTKETPDNPNLNPHTTRVDIPPSFFYTNSRMIITCQKVADITSGRWVQKPSANLYPISKIDWSNLTPAQIAMRTNDIRMGQSKCKKGCKCSDEGEIEEELIVVFNPKLSSSKPVCSNHDLIPEKCASLWGCICTAMLDQPAASIPGASREDYQRALDRIPHTIQGFNMGYQWHGAPGGGHMGFTPLDFGVDVDIEDMEDNNDDADSNDNNDGPPLFGPEDEYHWDGTGELPPAEYEDVFGPVGLDFLKDFWKYRYGGGGGGSSSGGSSSGGSSFGGSGSSGSGSGYGYGSGSDDDGFNVKRDVDNAKRIGLAPKGSDGGDIPDTNEGQ